MEERRNPVPEIRDDGLMTEEELMAKHMRGLAEIEAGHYIRKTLAELEAMAEEAPAGNE